MGTFVVTAEGRCLNLCGDHGRQVFRPVVTMEDRYGHFCSDHGILVFTHL